LLIGARYSINGVALISWNGSIKSALQALHKALPTSIPTDSKAIILLKAVSHIQHLEGLLRRSDISLSLADVTWAEFPDLEFTTEEWRQRERVGGGDDPKGRFRLSLNEDEEVDVKPRMV
jgi:hypothetical protein